MRQSFVIILFVFLSKALFSQEMRGNLDSRKAQTTVLKVEETMIIDGELNEEVWSKTSPATNFSQYFPNDSIPAVGDTEIHLAFDDENLYVGIKCFTSGNEFVVESLRRDFSFMGYDNISLLFDTFEDETNALMFGINPMGVIREALISEGGRIGSGFDDSWDNKWSGEAVMKEKSWEAEMSIPFSTLRFKKGSKRWGMVVYRYDNQTNEITNWVGIPRNKVIMDLSFAGDVIWEEPIQNTGKNLSIIPYSTATITRDYENESQMENQYKFGVGGDAKISLSSGLNLDLTINPDFSQVEVDRQVTNLDRFEISFPERRQFFLENADLFSGFSGRRSNPFFSRRIGIALDTSTQINVQNTIFYGMRLSGKLNSRLRVGLLNMQTASQKENDLPSFNYTVLAAEQNVFQKSNIAFLLVNKQSFNAEDFGGSFFEYNRNFGVEYRLVSNNDLWRGKVAYHYVDSPSKEKNKHSHLTQLVYDSRKLRLEWVHTMIGAGYNPEVGFVPRKDILLLSPEATLNFYPSAGKISRHQLGVDYSLFYKLGQDEDPIYNEFTKIESGAELFWDMSLNNTGSVRIGVSLNDISLVSDFDPTRVQDDDVFLPAGSTHKFSSFSVNYRSDRRKLFNYRVTPLIGSFYNGWRYGVNGSFNYRYQPYGSISLDYTYNHIDLKDPFSTVDLWLVGPRLDLTFTKKIFFTTFVQFNNQSENVNVNARFQWRFKPVSDFFIVYTDNYNTDPLNQFESRNRALVLKLTYWLNL